MAQPCHPEFTGFDRFTDPAGDDSDGDCAIDRAGHVTGAIQALSQFASTDEGLLLSWRE